MNTASSSLHQAALLLHAVPQQDSAWLLEQLPPPVRQPLQTMLAELRALGIPPERDLLEQAIKAAGQVHAARSAAEALAGKEESALAVVTRRVQGLPAERVAHVLAREPALLLACLFDLTAWRWQEEVLALLGTARCQQVQAMRGRAAPCSPLFAYTLLTLLLAQAALHAPDRAAVAPTPRWLARIKAGWRRMRGRQQHLSVPLARKDRT